jgi:hypothetical protein
MVRQKPTACLHLALFCVAVITFLAMSIMGTTTVNIGGLFPLTPAADHASGRQNLAAVLLAIDQVNNKNDGIHDTLLDKFTVRAYLRVYIWVHVYCTYAFVRIFLLIDYFMRNTLLPF